MRVGAEAYGRDEEHVDFFSCFAFFRNRQLNWIGFGFTAGGRSGRGVFIDGWMISIIMVAVCI